VTGSPRAADLINEISQRHPKGYDLGLERIGRLLETLERPQDRLPPIFHVAGTNGKGSTLAFLRAILEAHGKCVHVHTSPHLVSWRERYRLAGRLVEDEPLAKAIIRVRDANGGEPITVFELLSAVMFLLFSEHAADFALVEVGLGGRLDATNVIPSPLVSVITPVSMDHEAWLGDSVAKIATEKGGIIKPGCPVVMGCQSDDARQVLENMAENANAPLTIQNQDFQVYEENGRMIYQDGGGLFDLPLPALVGEHQMENASTAIAAARMAGLTLENELLSKAMLGVTWPGRFQRLSIGTLVEHLPQAGAIWLDGGHNPAAGQTIATTLTQMGCTKPVLICGMLDTKRPDGFFAAFSTLQPHVFTVPLANTQADIPAVSLAKIANEQGLQAMACISLSHALDAVKDLSKNEPGRVLVFCGSLYLAGEVLEANGTLPD